MIITKDLSEAEVFNKYLKTVYHLEADYLETKSTNCGNNIIYLLELLKQHSIHFKSILLCQDATMQHRMEAGLRKYIEEDVTIINYAVYKATVITQDEELAFSTDIYGMWDVNKYVELLMGEIPRLSDNSDGYGPNGKNFICHIEIPYEVRQAFEYLKNAYGVAIREANPLYASK